MRQIVVLSGKGGTGKTSLAAALAHRQSLRAPIAMVDADVDASNLELVLSPRVEYEETFIASQKAWIDPAACNGCGACQDACRFDAIAMRRNSGYAHTMVADALACEGCAACSYVCPAEAIRMRDAVSGRWFRSETRFGPLLHARLLAGEGNSGKLVTLLRQHAVALATERGIGTILIDGSPGIGCPVISAAIGVDVALLVTEPTASGAHDLERILQTTRHFRVPAMVCINKSDIHPGWRDQIRRFCDAAGVPVAAELPYDEVFVRAMVHARAVTEDPDSSLVPTIDALWRRLCPEASSPVR
ncbi:MAG: ATP-binding protein [Anaerolineae bacterium]